MIRKIKALWRNVVYQTTVHARIDKLERKLFEKISKYVKEVKMELTVAKREILEVKREILEVKRETKAEILETKKEMKEVTLKAKKNIAEIIAKDVAGNYRLYDCDRELEKNYILVFNKYIKESNYKELFVNLTRGLGDNCVAQIVNILKRFDIVDGKKGTMSLYSKEEHKRLQESATMRAHILKVSDDLYCMNEYRLPVDRFSVNVHLFIDRYGIDSINLSALDNKNIIDAGAFIGDSLLIFHKLTKGKVYSFEPLSSNYDLLLKTIELNDIKNCVPIKMGLGDDETKQPFVNDGTSSKQAVAEQDSDKELEYVEMTSLDKFVETNNISVGLIKVDVEGDEQLLLKGAKKTICSQRPILIISIYHSPEDFFLIKPEIESWNLGYKFSVHKQLNSSIITETVLIAQII